MFVRRWIPIFALAFAGATACDRLSTAPELQSGQAAVVRAAVVDAPVATRSHLLVDAAWLLQHGKRSNEVVLYFGTQAKYDAGHIAGARFIALTQIQENRGTVLNEFKDLATLRAVLEGAGVSTRDRVIVTGDRVIEAARGFLLLEYLGYPQVSLLDGGLPAWQAVGGEVSLTATPAQPEGKLANPPRLGEVVSTDWLLEHYADAGLTVIDALPAATYAVQHIAGAKNLPYTSLMASNDKLVDKATMQQLFAVAGVDAENQRVVVYCASGMTSAVNYFVARYLGFDVSLYDSSWQGWAAVGGPKEP